MASSPSYCEVPKGALVDVAAEREPEQSVVHLGRAGADLLGDLIEMERARADRAEHGTRQTFGFGGWLGPGSGSGSAAPRGSLPS